VRPDVLHTHTPKAGVLGRILGRASGVPVVVDTCHGLWTRPDQARWVRSSVVAAEAFASRFAHAELYQNAQDRETMRPFVGRRRGEVVGNGIDLHRFDGAGRERVRAELGVGPDDLLVGGVGRMVREKGIEEFAALAGRLQDRAHFVWVGPDDDSKADALRRGRLGPAVRFTGVRHDMPAVYAALDVFVLPSWREGFSRSAMEAAASSLPLVLSDIRGCREVGDHEVHLLLVPPKDPDALCSAVTRLLGDQHLRKRLAVAARARALEHFDQRAVAHRSLSTYVAVARRRGLPWRLEAST
jgi:glycosyltransferase involved in cell wall biosynthesis